MTTSSTSWTKTRSGNTLRVVPKHKTTRKLCFVNYISQMLLFPSQTVLTHVSGNCFEFAKVNLSITTKTQVGLCSGLRDHAQSVSRPCFSRTCGAGRHQKSNPSNNLTYTVKVIDGAYPRYLHPMLGNGTLKCPPS